MPDRRGQVRTRYHDTRSALRRLVTILGKAYRVFDAVVYRQRQQTQAINEMNSRLARIESLLSAAPMFADLGRVTQSDLERDPLFLRIEQLEQQISHRMREG